ncbi:MAG: DUF349 domain-containing protein [Bacteroidaceae bacterium]|nr:DUF349 domain-containing protein [Bacteroidaceae bacterium]
MTDPDKQAIEQPVETTAGTEAQEEQQVAASVDNVAEEPVANEEEEVCSAEEERVVYTSKEQIMERMRELAASDALAERTELDSLKQVYYRLQKGVMMDAYKEHIDGGGEPETFVQPVDDYEGEFKALMTQLRARRAEAAAEQERIKAENLSTKLQIIERIKELAASPEQANGAFDEFRTLQTTWKETGAVPAEQATTVWKTYQLYVEQFYDQLKMNNELREYDFKKNLEVKTRLCEQAEALADEENVISAFQQLQTLHQEWKETGPVARELREDIWNRFKEASTVINKRHQDHFEALKAAEEENLAKKEELCVFVEEIKPEELTTFAQWEDKTKEVLAYQAKWRTIGFATPKMHNAVFTRFREACDKFFSAKSEFFKTRRAAEQANVEAKTRLCEQAEALKDSTEWRATAERLQALQQEWKQTGPVPRKLSDELWSRFRGACDAFFSAKSEADKGTRGAEQENLAAKRSIIDELKALAEQAEGDVIAKVKELQTRWNEIGHVPFREKDKVFGDYRAICDKLYDEFGRQKMGRRMEGFRRNLETTVQQGGDALARERDRLLRIRDNMRQEIATYENNLGFLTASSKSGNSLVDQMRRKAEKLREELALLVEKIKTIEKEM